MKSNSFQKLDGSGLRIAIIAARFNQDLTDAMLADCQAALTSTGVSESDVRMVRVPGSFELPVLAAELAFQEAFDAIICLGVIIKGDTRHDQFIAEAVAQGLTRVSIDHHLPVIFGVLTTEDRVQAEVRSLGGKKKGYEAGMSAVEMAQILRSVRPM